MSGSNEYHYCADVYDWTRISGHYQYLENSVDASKVQPYHNGGKLTESNMPSQDW